MNVSRQLSGFYSTICPFFLILIIFLSNFSLNAQVSEFTWGYDAEYKNSKVFLHELLNYAPVFLWDNSWERNYLKRSGVMLSSGSIKTDILLADMDVRINSELMSGLWFRGQYHLLENLHRSNRSESLLLGFEAFLWRNYSVFVLCDPKHRKETLDLVTGISWSAEDKESYIRFALVFDDMVYDHKNRMGGKTTTHPEGVSWHIRQLYDKFVFYSKGKISKGFSRQYPDTAFSPVLLKHKEKFNEATVKIYYLFPDLFDFAAGLDYYYFSDKKNYHDILTYQNYSFENEIFDNYLKLKLKSKLLRSVSGLDIRAGVHFLWQNSMARGYKEFEFERGELLTELYFEYERGRNKVDIGYIRSDFDWDYDWIGDMSAATFQEFYRNEYLDKLKLGYYFRFSKNSSINFSLSHIIKLSGFGGGNIQYICTF